MLPAQVIEPGDLVLSTTGNPGIYLGHARDQRFGPSYRVFWFPRSSVLDRPYIGGYHRLCDIDAAFRRANELTGGDE